MAAARSTHLILGDGVAGMSAAEAIRARRPGDRIVVVSEDPQPFYYRASLTNYLMGELSDDELWGLPPDGWEQMGVERVAGRAVGLDAAARVVRMAKGPALPYERLLVATGARAKRLATPEQDSKHGVPGANLPGVVGMRTLYDVQRLIEALPKTKRAVVLGGGILGIELAQGLRARNVAVTLVHRGPWILERVVDRRAGELIQRRMERDGVEVVMDSAIAAIEGGAKGVKSVTLADGRSLPSSLVALAIGTVPNTEWLAGSGVALRDGLVPVDRRMRVEGPDDVFAAGDVAAFVDARLPFRNPGGLWQPARKQGHVAGLGMAEPNAPRPAEYRPGAVYNATRAWDLDLGTLGDHVDAGGEGSRSIAFEARKDGKPVYKRALLRGGHVVGVQMIGDRREGHALKRLMDLEGTSGDASAIANRLFDPEFDLFAWVASQERQPGAARFKGTVLLPRGPLPPSVAAGTHATNQRSLATGPRPATGLVEHAAPRPLTLRFGKEERRFDGDSVRVGGAPICDVVVRDPSLADEELVLAREGAVWRVSSTGGRRAQAMRNGLPLVQAEALSDRDVVQLGSWKALVRLSPLRAAPAAADGPRRPSAWLVGRERHPIRGSITTIGRGADNRVVLDEPGVSLFHAQIHSKGSPPAHFLVDAGSEEGTFVDDERIFVPRRLARGDVIRLASTRLLFHDEEDDEGDVGEGAGGDVAEEMGRGEGEGEAARAAGETRAVVHLVCLEGPMARRAVAVPVGGTVGRGVAADARIDDPLLSRVHARFTASGSTFAVVDVGSVNGLSVDDERVPPGAAVPLKEGSRLRIGRNVFRFQTSEPTERALTVEETGDPRTGETGTVALREDGPRLEEAQAGAPALHLLGGDDIVLGRSPQNDIVLPRSDVSKHHAKFVRSGGSYAVVDLHSSCGTRVNHMPLVADQPRVLADGDVVEIATCALTFRLGSGVSDAAGAGGGAGRTPGARATLTVEKHGPGKPIAPITVTGDGPFVLGRDRKTCAVHVPIDTVSRRHAEIRREGGSYRVRDLESRYGTFVNGSRVPPEGARVQHGDVIGLQDVEIRFEVEGLDRLAAGAKAAPRAFAIDWAGVGNPLETDLAKVVEEELDACIGCHDCMRACPLPDAGAVTIGALNAYALGLGAPTDVVRRFVADCTQCQACVPVCPADLRRSRMVLWNKLKDLPGPERRLSVQVGKERVDSDWTLGRLAERLAEHSLLRVLSGPERLALLGQARYRRLAPGEKLIAEGAYADALWLVIEGRLEVGMATGAAAFQSMVTLTSGQTVGEAALLSDQPSDVTAKAVETATLVGFPKYVLDETSSRSDRFRAALDSLYVSKSVEATLQRLPSLRDVSDDALGDLTAHLHAERYGPGDALLLAKDYGSVFAIVRRGFVREIRADAGRDGEREIVANYLKAGDAFGARDSGRRGSPLRFEASTKVEILTIRTEDLRAVESRRMGLSARLLPLARGGVAPARGDTASFQAAEGAGLLQARDLLVIDTRLCVDCDNCVTACERRHGTSRLDRTGSARQVGPFQVPASCYHCDDPVCLLCAVDGIVREPSGEIRIVEDACIGCGACAERCPYDNIRMAPREERKPSFVSRLLPNPLLRLLGMLEDASRLPDPERLAVKCDLCAGHDDGPACVRSCPVGAAFRGNPLEIFGSGGGGGGGASR